MKISLRNNLQNIRFAEYVNGKQDGQQRGKEYLLTCVPKEDSYQPAQPRSLTSVFVVRIRKVCILGYPKCAQ